MELKNRKVAVLGDSITQGVGVEDLNNLYHARLAKKYGWDLYADGISGTRIAPQNKPSEEPSFDKDFISRVKDIPADSEIVVFFGGTNDYGHGDAPFGNWGDETPETFCGAVYYFMKSLIEQAPQAVFCIMTPLHRLTEDELSVTNGRPLYDYVEIIRQTAEFFALPVLDLFKMAGLQPRVPVIMEKYVPDGLHPNDEGQGILAERLEGFLNSL